MQERFKKNRFRKLVPSSTLEPQAQHLSHLLTHHSNSHLARDQPQPRDPINRQHSLEPDCREAELARGSKGGRMKTISSLQEAEPDKPKNHQISEVRMKRHRQLVAEGTSERREAAILKKLEVLASAFRSSIGEILGMGREEYEREQRLKTIEREAQNFEESHEELLEQTKGSSSKLIAIYLSRSIERSKRIGLNILKSNLGEEEASEVEEQNEGNEADYLSSSILPVCPPSSQEGWVGRDRKLLNIGRFFDSK